MTPMNRRRAVTTLAAAALVARPGKAAGETVAIYLKRWRVAKKFTLMVAEAMPAEHYGFKPTPEMRGFGDLMAHLSGANTRYFARIKGTPSPFKDPQNPDKATAIKYMTETFDWTIQALEGLSEEDLAKSYPGTGNQPALTGRDLVLNAFIHTAHHRGYSEPYLRLKGAPVPRYEVF
jgi:uncharacterized damage-inducible protein DinB